MNFKTFIDAILQSEGRNSEQLVGNNIETIINDEIAAWTSLMQNCPDFIVSLLPCHFMYDYQRAEMAYVSPAITHLLGFDHALFTGAKGVIKFMDLVNPNDFKVYNEQIFPKDILFLKSIPPDEARLITFSNNFRMKQSNGLYKIILMKKCFLLSPSDHEILFEIGLLTDISSIKKELSITHTIERINKELPHPTLMKVLTEDFFPEMHAHILSAREKEILLHLSKGNKRKEVGLKLFISDNTVANHIKTILRKTHSKNIREAIDICKMNGII